MGSFYRVSVRSKSVQSQEDSRAWDDPLLTVAGIWLTGKGGSGKAVESCKGDGHRGGHL